MESELFQQDEELSVYILHNFRGMLVCPPELNESVSHMIVKGITVWKFFWNQEFMTTRGAQLSTYPVCKIKMLTCGTMIMQQGCNNLYLIYGIYHVSNTHDL